MTGTPSDYGNLATLVRDAGCVIAAAGALALAWRGRARWEPSEEDVPKGAQKVAGLITAIAVVLLWYWLRDARSAGVLTRIAAASGAACFLSLLIYAFLISVYTFTSRRSERPNEIAESKIVGGFWLNTESREIIRKERVTEQELLEGAAYNPDKLWPRPSRALSKMAFVISYIALTCCGTVALAAVSLIYGLPR